MYDSEPDYHDPGRLREDDEDQAYECVECTWRGTGFREMGNHYWATRHAVIASGLNRSRAQMATNRRLNEAEAERLFPGVIARFWQKVRAVLRPKD